MSYLKEASHNIMKFNRAVATLHWSKLTENAFEPVRSTKRAAGLDLCSAYNAIVPARSNALIFTDLQIRVPTGTYGRIAPRSGLAVRSHIDVGAGVIDEDYRGNVGVVLFNHSDVNFHVHRGQRIAQLICEQILYPKLEQVERMAETATERGARGFGSTDFSEVRDGSIEPTNNVTDIISP